MKLRILLILFIIILTETVFIPLPLTFVAVYLLLSRTGQILALEIFAAGLLLDFFRLHTLGTNSLFFLSILLIGGSFGKQISSGNIYFQVILFVVYMFGYVKLFYNYDFKYTTLLVLIGVCLIVILHRMIPVEKASSRKLAV